MITCGCARTKHDTGSLAHCHPALLSTFYFAGWRPARAAMVASSPMRAVLLALVVLGAPLSGGAVRGLTGSRRPRGGVKLGPWLVKVKEEAASPSSLASTTASVSQSPSTSTQPPASPLASTQPDTLPNGASPTQRPSWLPPVPPDRSEGSVCIGCGDYLCDVGAYCCCMGCWRAGLKLKDPPFTRPEEHSPDCKRRPISGERPRSPREENPFDTQW